MIGSLRGVVAASSRKGETLIEVGGVGYRVACPSRLTFIEGAEALVHTHTHVREDAISLFGFPTADERDVFERLISAQGIGPSLALAILSDFSPDELRAVVEAEDSKALTRVSGVGAKTAAKVILDLRGKLGSSTGAAPAVSPARSEALAALAALGYEVSEARAAVSSVGGDTSQDIVKAALKHISAVRRGV